MAFDTSSKIIKKYMKFDKRLYNMAPKNQWKYNKMLICTCVFGQMLSRHLTLEVIMSDITDVQKILNINFTGIHIFDYLFCVKLYEK